MNERGAPLDRGGASDAGEHVLVERVLNNNVVLCRDARSQPLVLMARGLGFNRRPGDRVPTAGAQRFVAAGGVRAEHLSGVLSQATTAQVEVAGAIVALAQQRLGLAASQALLLPVLDHLCGAVRRAEAGVVIDFPLVSEVAQLYPREASAGRASVALVEQHLHVRLQPEEWVAFALHFINQQWAHPDMARTVQVTSTLDAVFGLLEQQWSRPIDRTSLAAARFMTHLRYLLARGAPQRASDVGGLDLLAVLRTSSPTAAGTADRVAELLSESLRRGLGTDERAYLALHVARLHAEVVSGTDAATTEG